MTAGVNLPILELDGVVYRAGATEILSGVDLRVRAGEWHALIGPNGAGKSTVFDVISGRVRPRSGRVMFDGRDIQGLAPHVIRRRGVARAFQLSMLFDGLSVFENLRIAALGAAAAHRASDTIWRRLRMRTDLAEDAERLLGALGFDALRDERVASLAYAQRRLLELGLAFAGAPSLILLDEPTAGMTDDEARRTVALLRTLAAGKTLLIVEHDMHVVLELAQRISVLAQGVVIASGTPDAIRADAEVRRAYAGAFPTHGQTIAASAADSQGSTNPVGAPSAGAAGPPNSMTPLDPPSS